MKKYLQNFYSFLSEELKCENNGVYVIKEKEGSTFRHIAIKKYGNFFVLKQKDGFKAGLFKDAILSCDFIAVIDDEVFFVELKSNSASTEYINDENPLEKALRQCKGSEILFDYLCDVYNYQNNKILEFKERKFIYLFPQRANKRKASTNLRRRNLSLKEKAVKCDTNGYLELDLQFFKNID